MERHMKPDDKFVSIPSALIPYCEMDIEDSRILIYSGDYSLKNGDELVILTGDIYYALQYEYHLDFQGIGTSLPSIWQLTETPTELLIPNGMKGECIITESKTRNGVNSYHGLIQSLFPEQKACSIWHWSYVNMQSFYGSFVRHNKGVGSNRLSFLCKDGTRIIIENLNAENKDQQLTRITHRCELTPSDGRLLNHNDAQKYIKAFTHFISFVVGKYHSPILVNGQDIEGFSSFYHRVYYDKSRIGVNSWLPYPYDRDVESLWPTFEAIWNGEDEDKADILSTAVHWYLEANIGSGKMEGAYIMAITGLEMMWNVILNKEEQTAGETLQNLLKKMNHNPSFDAESLIRTRNQLTHYDSRNRKKYQKITQEQKLQSLDNALNILELTILYWLGYQGRYADRICESKWRGASTKRVPWALASEGTPTESTIGKS